jgi:hypothetical protein
MQNNVIFVLIQNHIFLDMLRALSIFVTFLNSNIADSDKDKVFRIILITAVTNVE